MFAIGERNWLNVTSACELTNPYGLLTEVRTIDSLNNSQGYNSEYIYVERSHSLYSTGCLLKISTESIKAIISFSISSFLNESAIKVVDTVMPYVP